MAEALRNDTALDELNKKFEEASVLFKALSHPLRLKLICGLIKEPKTQTAISKTFGIPQSSLAQHILVLRRAGIVKGRREKGAEVILEVIDPRIPRIFKEVCDGDEYYLKYNWDKESEKFPCLD